MGELEFCTLNDILGEVFRRLIADITTDNFLPIFLIRAIHNKIFYGIFFTCRCYFQYLDVFRIAKFTSPFILPLIFLAFKRAKNRERIILMAVLFVFPLFLILNPFYWNNSLRMEVWRIFLVSMGMKGCLEIFLKKLKGENEEKAKI